VRAGLKEPGRRKNPGRARTRGIERVTGSNFNPIRIIVKLRNILKKRRRKGDGAAEKSKGGED